MNPILEVDHLCCGYQRNINILDNLSFSVESGDFLGIIGPNGAGKTTIFRSLSGYLPPRSGKVLLDHMPIHQLNGAERSRQLAVVPQELLAPLPYTVREIVEIGRVSRLPKFAPKTQYDWECIQKAMVQMEVENFANVLFNHLSGGEKQRVMIAMALAQEPKILLLDEPTSQLDIGHASHLMKILEDLNKTQGITILLISHDIHIASSYCSQLILLNDGKVLAVGKPEEVLTAELISQAYSCKAKVTVTEEKQRFVSVK